MPYVVGTDHRVVDFGDNQMVLFDSKDGTELVVAQRRSMDSLWVVRASIGDVPERRTDSRRTAIYHMRDLALEVLPGTGFSMLVPHGLMERP